MALELVKSVNKVTHFLSILHRFLFFEDVHDKRIVLLATRQFESLSMDQLYCLTKQCNCLFENQDIFKANFMNRKHLIYYLLYHLQIKNANCSSRIVGILDSLASIVAILNISSLEIINTFGFFS